GPSDAPAGREVEGARTDARSAGPGAARGARDRWSEPEGARAGAVDALLLDAAPRGRRYRLRRTRFHPRAWPCLDGSRVRNELARAGSIGMGLVRPPAG